jgi:hypothetical protein
MVRHPLRSIHLIGNAVHGRILPGTFNFAGSHRSHNLRTGFGELNRRFHFHSLRTSRQSHCSDSVRQCALKLALGVTENQPSGSIIIPESYLKRFGMHRCFHHFQERVDDKGLWIKLNERRTKRLLLLDPSNLVCNWSIVEASESGCRGFVKHGDGSQRVLLL